MNEPTKTTDLAVNASATLSQSLAQTLDYISNLHKIASLRRVDNFEYTYVVPQIENLGTGEIAEGAEIQFGKLSAVEVTKKIQERKFGVEFTSESMQKMIGHQGSKWTEFTTLYANAVNDMASQTLKNSIVEQIMNCFYIDHRKGILTYADLKNKNKLFVEETITDQNTILQAIKKWMIKGRTLIDDRNHLPSNSNEKLTIILQSGMFDDFIVDKQDAEIVTLVGGIQYLKYNSNVDILFFNTDAIKYYDVNQDGTRNGAEKIIENYMLMFKGVPFEILVVNLKKALIDFNNEFKIDDYGLIATEMFRDKKKDINYISSKFGLACHLKNTSAPLLVNFQKGA